MTQIKAFAMLVVVAFTVDAAAYGGVYRHALGHSVNHAAHEISNLHWTGFLG